MLSLPPAGSDVTDMAHRAGQIHSIKKSNVPRRNARGLVEIVKRRTRQLRIDAMRTEHQKYAGTHTLLLSDVLTSQDIAGDVCWFNESRAKDRPTHL